MESEFTSAKEAAKGTLSESDDYLRMWAVLCPLPLSTSSPPDGIFLTVHEPTLTHHNHPKWTISVRVHSWYTFSGLGKCTMTSIHHYGIIQNSSAALKILCGPPIHPASPLNPGNQWPFFYLQSFTFSRMLYSWNHTVGRLFRLASGPLSTTCIFNKIVS